MTEAGLAWPPKANGPVPLDEIIGEFSLFHEEIPGLTRTAAIEHFLEYGLWQPSMTPDETPLAGFIIATHEAGAIFVRRDDPISRRRFSAAHELGHYLLHFQAGDETLVQGDTPETLCEPNEEEDWAEIAAMEREANRFAAELLMPAAVIDRLARQCAQRYRPTMAFLVNHLASNLLVSRQAIRWRLRELNFDLGELGTQSSLLTPL